MEGRARQRLSLSQRGAAEHDRPSPRSGRRMFGRGTGRPYPPANRCFPPSRGGLSQVMGTIALCWRSREPPPCATGDAREQLARAASRWAHRDQPKFALFITASICFAILPGPNLFRIRRSLSIALFTLASDASNFSLNILILSMSASPAAIALSSLSIPSSQKVKLLAFETALCSGPTFNKTKISCINATYAPPVCRHKFSRVSERPNRPDPTSRAIAAHVHSIDGWRRTDGA